jgi:hypothetical protein
MNSLMDIALWSGLALVLGSGLVLALVSAVILRGDEGGKRRPPRAKARSSARGAGVQWP